MQVTATRNYEQLKIYINGVLHLHIKLLDLVCFQSWIHGEKEYMIQFTFKQGEMTAAYGEKDKWVEILKILDEKITT